MEVKPTWMVVAEKELGTHEIAGDADNPRIVEYHSATTLKATDDETAWCSAFVNWVFKQVGIKGTGSAAARSWMTWGEKVNIEDIHFGDVVVFARGTNPAQGHVAFFVAYSDVGRMMCLGGNQGNEVSIDPQYVNRILAIRSPKV